LRTCWLTWICLGRGDRTLPGQHRGDPRFSCLAAWRPAGATSPSRCRRSARRSPPKDALGEQFDQRTVEVFGQGTVLLYYRVAQQERIIQVVELLWLG
jgi:hypothetical protein